MKKLTVMVPCYNEEKGITKVISKIPRAKLKALGYEVEVLVIDNNSKDRTTEVAKKAGARVVFEGKQGKGHAIRKGVKSNTFNLFIYKLTNEDRKKGKNRQEIRKRSI